MEQNEPRYLDIRLKIKIKTPWGYSKTLGLVLRGLRSISERGGSRRAVAERMRQFVGHGFTEAMLRDAEQGMGLSAERVALLLAFYGDVLSEVSLRSAKDDRKLIDVTTSRRGESAR